MSGSLRDGRVRAFLAAEAVSAIGSWATVIAIWGYASFEFDASAAEVAGFGVAFSLPAVLLGPVTGTIIDRVGPKATLGAAKALGVAASLALLAADDFATLVILSALHGIAAAFAMPALQAIPPRIVGPDDQARTNALVALTDQLAIVLGPVAGGIAIGWFGFRGAFVFDAGTYLLGLAVLPLLPVRSSERAPDAPAATFRQAFDGWRVVARTPVLLRTVVATGTIHLLYGAALLAEPLYVRDVLERPPSTFAALQTVFGICLVASGIVVARLDDRIVGFGWVALGVAASGLAAIVYLSTTSVVVAFVGVAAWGLCTALLGGPSRTLLQRHAAESVHGRVLAADHVTGSAAQLVGIASTGILVESLGVPLSIVLLGIFVVVVAGVLESGARNEQRLRPATST